MKFGISIRNRSQRRNTWLNSSLAAAFCASLTFIPPALAETVNLTPSGSSSTTGIDLSTAPVIPLDHAHIEEGYLQPEETRQQAAIDHSNQAPEFTARLRHIHGNDTLIVETGVHLSRDRDDDGYYSAFSLEFDVDTRDQLDVYANVFLQRQYQSPRLLHTTRSFHLYGDSRSDEYRLEVTLTNDFPAGLYDLIIEIRDDWSDELLDTVSEASFRNLGGLPLEDESHHIPRSDGSSVVVEYAGATTPLGLLALVLAFFGMQRGRGRTSLSSH